MGLSPATPHGRRQCVSDPLALLAQAAHLSPLNSLLSEPGLSCRNAPYRLDAP